MSQFLTSSTNRELKIRIFDDTSFLLIDKKTPFSSRSTISFCLNAVNDDDESMLMILKMTLTIDAEYFLDRPRSHLIGSMNDDVDSSVMSTIESAGSGLVRSRLVCSDDEDSRLDDMSFRSTSDDKF
jgi:hypothetical protein